MPCDHPERLVATVVQHSGNKRLSHHRCTRCSLEWTDTEQTPPLDEPVTTDEVIEVHEVMSGDNVSLEDLL